jgi:hypothetical protein
MINLQITYADGTTKEVEVGAKEIIAFEAKFDKSIATIEKDVRLTHLYFLAWSAEKRLGSASDDFDKWLDNVKIVEAPNQKK